MAFVMDNYFKYLIKQLGMPDASEAVAPELIKKYRGKLPDRLLEYWEEFGFCRFCKGLYWIVNPDDFAWVVDEWLPDEFQDKAQCYVIARSAFGKLLVWSKQKGQCYYIEPINDRVFVEDDDADGMTEGENQEIQIYFASVRRSSADKKDVGTGESIFDYAVENFGPLNANEMFTFEPVFFLGGEQTCKHVRKVDMQVHFDILTGLASKEVMTLADLAKQAFG